MFILQNTTLSALELPGVEISQAEFGSRSATFDLTLFVADGPDGLSGGLDYSPDLFEAATIQRMIGHFEVLLQGIIADPDQSITTLPLLTPSEREQLLVTWNQTERDYPRDLTLHQLFETQAAQTPHNVAVVFEDQQLTYCEMEEKANQVAHLLRKLGVGPDKLVGICLARSLDMVVGLLGILKAGGAYVPLDPMFPQERLAYMLADSQPLVLLTQSDLAERFPDYPGEVICLDTDQVRIAQEKTHPLPNQPDSANLAYVIYTSGSTGKPKGVQLPHQAVVNFLTSMQERPGLTAQDYLLAVTTLSFDIAVLEIFLPLITGAQLLIVSRAVAADGMQLRAHLERFTPTVMQATPTTWRLLLAAGWAGDPQLKVLCGGEVFPRDLANILRERCAAVWNMYGPTETTIWSTIQPVGAGEGPLSIGRPIANTQIYVLDSYQNPVPLGVAGELYIGGAGLARGYFKRPGLTEAKFVPHPFSERPEARLYRTGDLVRYRLDGTIEFIGRIDHQVKIRGYRIELGEIESNLAKAPEVRQAVTIVREDTPGDKRLVAYLSVKNGKTPTPSLLREYLADKLPNYMIPSAFVLLDEFPLTPNGKVNRQALPLPDRIHGTDETVTAPRDPLELQLFKIWEQILGGRAIGIQDNFFELGGHSLLAIRLITEIDQVFGRHLPLAVLFQAPTIEQLANVLREKRQSDPVASLVPLQIAGDKRPLFFVPGNLGNVFLDLGQIARHLAPDQPFYGFQDKADNPARIKTMAAQYVAEIQAIQPEGPYHLGGICSGGIVALEIAQQLTAKNQAVALLAVVESFPHRPSLTTYLKFTRSLLQRVINKLTGKADDVEAEALPQPLKTSGPTDRSTFWRLKSKVLANMIESVRYAPQKFAGRVDTFFTAESLNSPYQPDQMWANLALSGAKRHHLPGTHDGITGDHGVDIDPVAMRTLAEILTERIEEVS